MEIYMAYNKINQSIDYKYLALTISASISLQRKGIFRIGRFLNIDFTAQVETKDK